MPPPGKPTRHSTGPRALTAWNNSSGLRSGTPLQVHTVTNEPAHAPAQLPELPAHITAEYLATAPMDELCHLLPLYQQRATWLAQEEVFLDTRLQQVSARLENPFPVTTHAPDRDVLYPVDQEPPATVPRVCYTIYYHCVRSEKINAAWRSFPRTHGIHDWTHAQPHFFRACHEYVSSLCRLEPPMDHWQPQVNMTTTLRDTFDLDHCVDGAVWPIHFQHLMHPWNPSSRGRSPYLSDDRPAKFLWCIQQNPPPLEPPLARARRGLPTKAVIMCPDSHPYHDTLMQYEQVQIHVMAHARKLTTHATNVTHSQKPFTQPITIFWIHVDAAPVLQHNVLSNLRPLMRKAKGQVHPIPTAWALHESRDTIYRRFWSMWNTTTARLRNRTGWTNKNYADAYDTRTSALRWAPQPRLRRLWNLRKYRRVTSNRTGRWIYAIYSVKSCKVYVGQTGDRGTLKSLVQRMRQHLTCARSWHTLYGSKGCTNLGSIYPAMATLGDEHWGIMTLEECTPGTANKRERWWIRKLFPTLNVRDVPTYSRRWELLFRANLVPKVPARERLRDTIHTLTTTLRCTASPSPLIAEDINAETRKRLCRSVWCNTHEQRQLQAGRNFGQVCSKGK